MQDADKPPENVKELLEAVMGDTFDAIDSAGVTASQMVWIHLTAILNIVTTYAKDGEMAAGRAVIAMLTDMVEEDLRDFIADADRKQFASHHGPGHA